MLFNRRTRCDINTLWLFVFTPYDKTVFLFCHKTHLILQWVYLFGWGFFAYYSLFKQNKTKKLLIWHCISQSPGVLIWKRVRTESPYQPWCCSVPETQQTGDRTHSWVYLPGQCALNTKKSFDLVDVNANFYHASLNIFWARLQKIRVWCMIRSL